MAEHEPCVGASDERYTPPEIFQALGLVFDLDPCSPGPGHWVPAHTIYTRVDDGLAWPWFGRVFVNPPFGGRHGHLPWIERFLDHGDGIAIVRAYTSAGWFHDLAVFPVPAAGRPTRAAILGRSKGAQPGRAIRMRA